MSRVTRLRGRHRIGIKHAPVLSRFWDGAARSAARRLDERWQGWLVMYGTGSRLFYAVAAWPVPEPLILTAPTAAELEALMRQHEMILAAQGTLPGLAWLAAA
ncbi:hypothetical protein ACFY05_41880 [Microtetraspora fusca]|uniref:Uncharacterized protein n=1 Tax=Microtetraspora fusca TaxID=1997 RepID=A0ABW6VJW9_MICFU